MTPTSNPLDPRCSPKPSLAECPLLAPEQAAELEELFQILANDTRLRLLHAIVREGERCVTDLAAALEMKPQAISNQLQRLLDRKILVSRRAGNNVFYRVVDPCVAQLLDFGLCLVEDARSTAE